MTHAARRESGSGVHHVTMRGAGRRRIFEDDRDRRYFVEGLRELVEKDRVELLAWCLMDNHVHMLAKADLLHLSKGLHRLATSYALFFNGRHGHVGPVFQDRFGSLPVETDEHLLMAMRYIHLNPLDAGRAFPGDYRWSSYGQYAGNRVVRYVDRARSRWRKGLVRRGLLRSRSWARGSGQLQRKRAPHKRRRGQAAGRDLLRGRFLRPIGRARQKRARSRPEETQALGLSIRQIERLTGIGRGIILRA